jgi:P27 family predicted phage terminase small subunit
MARTGRPSKPVEVKRRTGNPGKRRLPVPKVTIPGALELPTFPPGLPEVSRQMWTNVWTYAKAWISPTFDQPMVETACRQWAELSEFRSLVAEHGALLKEPITTPTGLVVGERLVANPAVRMLRDAEKSFHSTMSALGIPPTDRARLGLVQIKAESKLEQLARMRTERMGQMPSPVLDARSTG